MREAWGRDPVTHINGEASRTFAGARVRPPENYQCNLGRLRPWDPMALNALQCQEYKAVDGGDEKDEEGDKAGKVAEQDAETKKEEEESHKDRFVFIT